jgi:anaerobic magnesium-protoporphyrin IX monomethyl ester cyclase
MATIVFADPAVKPEKKYDTHSFPNIGILSIIGYLRKNMKGDVRFHYINGRYQIEEHLRMLEELKPDVYCLSFATMIAPLAYETAKAVRERFPDMSIVCGGPHPTAEPEDVLNSSPIDVCVRGEGEVSALKTLGKLLRGESVEGIRGVVYRKGNKVLHNPLRPPMGSLDSVPMPAWDMVDLNDYTGSRYKKGFPGTCILVSRGCPFNCVFCSNPVWKLCKPWLRLRSLKQIVEEVRYLYEKKGIRELYIRADELNSSLEWSIEVCMEIARLGYRDLYFQCNLRADKVPEKLAKALSDMNCWMVHLGIESGNQRVLDGVRKQITLEQVVDACKRLKQHDIKVYGFFMMYQIWEGEEGRLQYETPKDVDNTLSFARKLLSGGLIDYISWSFTTPLPGSDLYRIAKEHDVLIPEIKPGNIWEISVKLPGVSEKDMKKSRMKGMMLQGFYALKSGHIEWRAWRHILGKVKYIMKSVIP